MIAVLGPGAVGGLIAGLLERSGVPVVLIAREQTAARLRADGLRIDSVVFGDFTVAPDVRATLDADVDALLIATKAVGLADALERVHGECGLVVPLLNGLDHLPLLRQRFGARAVAGAVRVNADRPRTGLIVHANADVVVTLASDDPSFAPAIEALAVTLRSAGIGARIGADEVDVMWRKLVRLGALACTTSAARRTLGEIRADTAWAALLRGAIEEGAAVARAEGAAIDAQEVAAELAGLDADARSSLARDLEAGQRSELDAIPGAILRAADRHRIEAPAIEELVAQIVTLYGVPAPRREASGLR